MMIPSWVLFANENVHTADGSATEVGRVNFAQVPKTLVFCISFDPAIPHVRIYLNGKITNKGKAVL